MNRAIGKSRTESACESREYYLSDCEGFVQYRFFSEIYGIVTK
jgi:hypothetical protein